jgi:hypothetical protein
MPTSQIMVKRLGAFRPTDDKGIEAMQKIGDGELVKVIWSRPRNIRFHNKFFAMLGIVLKNQEHYASMDELLGVCKLRVGHVTIVQTPQGEEQWPKSISFAKMDETEFSAFYDKAVDWVLKDVIPGLQRQHLDAEVEAELIGFAA